MLIDKNTCNKPLTLDCHVDSNPNANITWYRRRINKDQMYKFVLNKKHLTSLFSKIEIKKSTSIDDKNDYYDELIGTGPTYTIASFNCANLLTNLKNKTNEQKTNEKHINSSSNDLFKSRLNNKIQINKRVINSTDDKIKVKENNQINNQEEDDNVDNDYLEYTNEYNDDNTDYNQDQEGSYQTSFNDYNDFGIYLCEASNSLTNNDNSNQISRRYIKLNPNGTPILKAISSSNIAGSINSDEVVSELMKSSDSNQVEVAANIGSSISLTCIIEPLPQFDTIVWMNENDKVLSNSKYSINDDNNNNNNLDETNIQINTQTTQLQSNKAKFYKNFKFKYENLTLYNSKSASELNYDDYEQYSTQNDISLMRGVLFIKNLREQDLGVYKCKATNSYGSRTVSILLREKTFMDKLNLNNHLFLIISTSGILFIFIIIILLFVCLVSGRVRRALCCCLCCCCFKYAKKMLKDKDLLTQNLNCEQNSDKSINEWLVSSKLSNDTANGSLVNSGVTNNNNISTTTAISSSLNNADLLNTLKMNKKISTPNRLRLELNGNCASILNDEMDDDSDTNLEKSHHRLFLTTETTSNTFKRDENRSSSNTNNSMCYQSSQFNRYLVSSPLLSTSSQKDCSDESQDKTGDNTTPSPSSTSTTATNVSKTTTMLIRSPQNFNAKISSCSNALACEQQNLLNSSPSTTNTIKLNSFMYNRNLDTKEKDYYENNNNIDNENDEQDDDLTKILQDTTYRLSDLFNELSPSLIMNKNNNNYLTPTLSIKTGKTKHYHSSNMNNISPPPPPPPPPQLNESRQALLQAINSNNNNQANFNKFPNPFPSQTMISTTSLQPNITTKFYTNFYRNPNLSNSSSNEKCKNINIDC